MSHRYPSSPIPVMTPEERAGRLAERRRAAAIVREFSPPEFQKEWIVDRLMQLIVNQELLYNETTNKFFTTQERDAAFQRSHHVIHRRNRIAEAEAQDTADRHNGAGIS